ncbi:MAG: PUA domain-containing protein [Candidatus Caldarchaeum sp.]
MRRRSLSSSELEALLPRLRLFLGDVNVKKLLKRGAECIESTGFRVVALAGQLFVVAGEDVVPALIDGNAAVFEKLPSVWVDMGAVPHIAAGADVMRPGIVRMDVFENGDTVVVRDVVHSKAIAVGKALLSSSEAASMVKGKVVKTVHYIDDAAWKAAKELL